MAAFTTINPRDKNAFEIHWDKILSDESVTIKTIMLDGYVVGHISKFQQFGKPGVGYWIGKDYWGRGIATHALLIFLSDIIERNRSILPYSWIFSIFSKLNKLLNQHFRLNEILFFYRAIDVLCCSFYLINPCSIHKNRKSTRFLYYN